MTFATALCHSLRRWPTDSALLATDRRPTAGPTIPPSRGGLVGVSFGLRPVFFSSEINLQKESYTIHAPRRFSRGPIWPTATPP